jgi:hypothetical protein
MGLLATLPTNRTSAKTALCHPFLSNTQPDDQYEAYRKDIDAFIQENIHEEEDDEEDQDDQDDQEDQNQEDQDQDEQDDQPQPDDDDQDQEDTQDDTEDNDDDDDDVDGEEYEEEISSCAQPSDVHPDEDLPKEDDSTAEVCIMIDQASKKEVDEEELKVEEI